jgi:transcriptional regulator NrdR family protein
MCNRKRFQESKEGNEMNCYYCEKEIKENEERTALENKKKNIKVHLHYPHCHVRFTTFYKTEREFNEWKKNKYKN